MPQGPTAGEETRAWASALVTRHLHRARGLRVPCPLRPLYTLRGAWRRCPVTDNRDAGSTEDRMDRQIGEAAGRIWQYLAQHGAATLPQLQRGTALPERLVHMGVGWLAREDKLVLHPGAGGPEARPAPLVRASRMTAGRR